MRRRPVPGEAFSWLCDLIWQAWAHDFPFRDPREKHGPFDTSEPSRAGATLILDILGVDLPGRRASRRRPHRPSPSCSCEWCTLFRAEPAAPRLRRKLGLRVVAGGGK